MQKACCLLALCCFAISPQTATFAESQQDEHPVILTDTVKSVSASSRQIIVSVQLAEVSLSKFRKLDFDFSVFRENKVFKPHSSEASRFGNSLMYSTGHFGVLLDAMVQNKIARILADPTIVAVDGRTASLSVGGTVNIANQERDKKNDQPTFINIGTDLTILPTLLPNDRVSIDLSLEWSELCGKEKPFGSKRKYAIDTSLEAEMGSSILMSSISLVEESDAADENETALLLLVTPEFANQTALAKKSQTK